MKMIFRKSVVCLVLIVITILSYKIITTAHRKKVISDSIQTIPDFVLTALDGAPFSNRDLKKNIPTIFIYFNSACDFCQQEAKGIKENIQLFSKVQVLFLSPEPPDLIHDFARDYDLSRYSNVTFLNDEDSKVAVQFDISVIPSTLIYDKDSRLVKRHKGYMKAESIINEL